MTEYLRVPWATHNVHGPDKNAEHRRKALRQWLNAIKGGYGGINELSSRDYAYLKHEAAIRGLDVHIYGQNAIGWAPHVIHMTDVRSRKIMTGGNVGADGVATSKKGDDDRRVGPSRYCMYGQCTPVAFRFEHEVDEIHTMARAFTKHRWRIPLFRRAMKKVGAGITRKHGIIGGDVNTNDYDEFNLTGVDEHVVKTPGTFGHNRYDQIRVWGSLRVTNVREEATPSDHDMVKATVLIPIPDGTVPVEPDEPGTPPAPHPKPKPKPKPFGPKPGAGHVNWRKYGAPVRHPWATRSARWKRRHKRLQRRIVAWKADYIRTHR